MTEARARERVAVVAPEPVAWLGAVVAALSATSDVVVLAPWAMSDSMIRVAARLPGRIAGFARRRGIPGLTRLVSIPGWFAAEGMLRAWVDGRADRALEARFLVRAAVDRWVAGWLGRAGRTGRALDAIIAPSLAAHHTFARAASLGVRTCLLEDVPGIRDLHGDLDAAARRHPACAFLRRYRAPDRVLVRQEVERVLADVLWVRGAHARDQRRAAGIPDERIAAIPEARAIRPEEVEGGGGRDPGGRARVLLAGLAAARHGTVEALAAVAERPYIELLVRPGEGMEPRDLLHHPRVRAATSAELERLAGVDVVIAPSWCEAYTREVSLAGALGVPLVATHRAAGFVQSAHVVEPGDAHALGRALDRILGVVEAPRSGRDHGPGSRPR